MRALHFHFPFITSTSFLYFSLLLLLLHLLLLLLFISMYIQRCSDTFSAVVCLFGDVVRCECVLCMHGMIMEDSLLSTSHSDIRISLASERHPSCWVNLYGFLFWCDNNIIIGCSPKWREIFMWNPRRRWGSRRAGGGDSVNGDEPNINSSNALFFPLVATPSLDIVEINNKLLMVNSWDTFRLLLQNCLAVNGKGNILLPRKLSQLK